MIDLANGAAGTTQGFNGITSEPLLFILFVLVILFSANGLWGAIQKYIEKKKTKSEGTMEEKRLEFEIDKFSIETVQRAVITLNEDLKRIRSELDETKHELGIVKANHMIAAEKVAAMYRYIAKAASIRRSEGVTVFVPVDDVDAHIIPEIVSILR